MTRSCSRSSRVERRRRRGADRGPGSPNRRAEDPRARRQRRTLRGGSGHLVYGAAGTLRAVAFDLDRLEVEGTPVPVLPSVLTTPGGAADFDVARDGTLVYTPTAPTLSSHRGRSSGSIGRGARKRSGRLPGATCIRGSRPTAGVSRSISAIKTLDIWTGTLPARALTRVTFDPGLDQIARSGRRRWAAGLLLVQGRRNARTFFPVRRRDRDESSG